MGARQVSRPNARGLRSGLLSKVRDNQINRAAATSRWTISEAPHLYKCITNSGSRYAAKLMRIVTFLSTGSRYAAGSPARTSVREELTRTLIELLGGCGTPIIAP
jgi:hypothetical protein